MACSTKVVGTGSGSADEDDSGSGGSTTGAGGSSGGSSSTETASSTSEAAIAAGSTVTGAGTVTTSGGSGGGASSTDTNAGGSGGGTDTETSTSAGGTGESECPEDHRCVPEAPADWQGPVVVLDSAGTTSPGCPPEFPTLEFDANDVPVGGGGCTCDCSVQSATCHDPELTEFESGNTCTGEPLPTWIVSGECREKPNSGVFAQLTLPSPDIICASSVEEAFEPAEFAWAYRACSGAVAVGSCDAGSCLPLPSPPYHTTHCVYRDGEHQCPAAFPRQSLRFQAIEDTRFCEDECDCQPASGSGRGACTTTMQVYSEGCGELVSTFTLDASLCLDIPALSADVPEYQSGSARCQGEPPPVSGTLTGADVITACCTN